MTAIILTLLFITVLFIVIGMIISSNSRKNEKSRKADSTFIPPYMIGDSHHKHGHDQSNDSFSDFGGDSGGGGGGGD